MLQRQTLAMCIEWTIPSPLNTSPNHSRDSPTFQFSGCSWCMRVYPQGNNASGWISLYLRKANCEHGTKIISYVLGIKKTDDTFHTRSSMIRSFDEDNLWQGWQSFIKYDAEEIPSDSWTLTCRMICDTPLEGLPQSMLIKNYDTLSTNFKELLVSKNHCDVTIKVQSMEFQVHKAILMARSPVLAAAFEHDMSEKQTGVVTVDDCCPDSFKLFLEYLYTGTIEEYSWANVYHLYVIADKYNGKELMNFCVLYLMQNITLENVCDVFCLAEQYDETELMSAAQTLFCQNVNKVTATDEWEKLMTDNQRLGIKLLKHAACTNENAINRLRKDMEKSESQKSTSSISSVTVSGSLFGGSSSQSGQHPLHGRARHRYKMADSVVQRSTPSD